MRKWVDVNEGDWFYNDVMEATNMYLEDGNAFVDGMTYNQFESGKPFIFEEIKAVTSQSKFKLSKKITPSEGNPLYVFIDGVQTIYKSAADNLSGGTDVELYTGCKNGQIVAFCSYGVPLLDEDWKRPPVSWLGDLPRTVIPKNDVYFYDPYSRKHQEYLYAGGQPLRRLSIPKQVWQQSAGNVDAVTEIATKAIGYRTDVYCVSPGGSLFLPFNLNGVTCKFNYWIYENGVYKMMSQSVKATTDNPTYNNRFFPNSIITRGEAFHLINKLRKVLYARFTDMEAPTKGIDQTIIAFNGQRVFRLNGNFPAGKNKLAVKVNGVAKYAPIVTEIDNHTIVFNYPLNEGDEVKVYYKKGESERFQDVGRASAYYYQDKDERVESSATNWWKQSVSEMEDETFSNGDPLIAGFNIVKTLDGAAVLTNMGRPVNGNQEPTTWFLGDTAMTRAEAVTFLSRFRKWTLERFK
ncbi:MULTISPECIES: hypothetical protein [unclassified Paenibacillus]|uniref:hypothetical protein n=1 Tax=unclassified Paenibacillus TaxID=185978 RepID=UPI000899655D|nr:MULTISPECIES: hypothetical protein [unclassified Paenibacillus]OMC68648.1 hypothetical protein BK126_12530 [Paenibacillus sp. FSL H7-0326]SDW56239.1 hypothetical protein SAMN05518848_102187 [Paenibacillus sp. PDC88]